MRPRIKVEICKDIQKALMLFDFELEHDTRDWGFASNQHDGWNSNTIPVKQNGQIVAWLKVLTELSRDGEQTRTEILVVNVNYLANGTKFWKKCRRNNIAFNVVAN